MYDKNEEKLQRVHRRLDEQRAQLIAEDLLAADDTFSVELLQLKKHVLMGVLLYSQVIVESQLSCAVMEAAFVFEAVSEDLTMKNTLMKSE